MIARLVLAEKNINYEAKNVDIHVNLEQFSPAYVTLNPYLTIPTLTHGATVITSSRDILFYVDQLAATPALQPSDPAALANMQTLLDLQYAIQIEDFTFGKMLQKNPLMYTLMTKMFKKEMRICQTNSIEYPALKSAYQNKEKIISQREIDFHKENLAKTYASGKESIMRFLAKLDQQLATHEWAAGKQYSLADVVSTVLLARLEFSGEPELYENKPTLKRYYAQVKQRPSFTSADIWTHMHFSKIISMICRNLPVLFT